MNDFISKIKTIKDRYYDFVFIGDGTRLVYDRVSLTISIMTNDYICLAHRKTNPLTLAQFEQEFKSVFGIILTKTFGIN